VTVGNQSALIAFMPTGGTSNVLCGNPTPYPCPSDILINAPGDVLDASGTGSEGAGGGVLTGQALALTLSVKLSNSGANPPGLASLALPVGDFCTCGTNPTTAGPFSISACVLENAGTVGDLLSLANQALRGVNLFQIDPCLTYSDIQAALNAINVGFDVCRELCSCGG
jgi:hypothetical protein